MTTDCPNRGDGNAPLPPGVTTLVRDRINAATAPLQAQINALLMRVETLERRVLKGLK
jgi:hypothetical protein